MESYDINRIDNILKHEFGHLFALEGRGMRGDQLIYEGRLRQGNVLSLGLLASRFNELGYDIRIQGSEKGNEQKVNLVFTLQGIKEPGSAAGEEKYGPHILLFLITFLSTLGAGALQYNVDIFKEPLKIWMGWPFAIPLMMILMAHEMGHYILSLRHKISATLPYFIPFPNIIGTMGAVIKMKSRIPNRKALIDVGMAGPLAGVFLSIPTIIIGLKLSTITMVRASSGLTGRLILRESFLLGGSPFLGESFLFRFLTWLIHGNLPSNARIVIHPIAFAGWLGLLVTFMNLFPASQLDGGHISYALFGSKHKEIGKIICMIFAIMGIFYWPWYIWMLFVFFIGLGHPSPVNDFEPLDRKRRILGMSCLALFVLTCTPQPFYGDDFPTSLISFFKELMG